jgi:hypothetical protein
MPNTPAFIICLLTAASMLPTRIPHPYPTESPHKPLKPRSPALSGVLEWVDLHGGSCVRWEARTGSPAEPLQGGRGGACVWPRSRRPKYDGYVAAMTTTKHGCMAARLLAHWGNGLGHLECGRRGRRPQRGHPPGGAPAGDGVVTRWHRHGRVCVTHSEIGSVGDPVARFLYLYLVPVSVSVPVSSTSSIDAPSRSPLWRPA